MPDFSYIPSWEWEYYLANLLCALFYLSPFIIVLIVELFSKKDKDD
jgi:hypothetical protein